MNIGSKLAEKRKALGITQAEIADKMHVKRQTVSSWESGAALPDIEKVAELADLLNVSCDYLLKDTAGGAVSRMLLELTGKKVKLNLFDYESDMDIYNKVCIVEGFEGNWMSVEIISPAKNIRKLVAVSSIMSFEIIN